MMLPQLGMLGGVPAPRKDRIASIIIVEQRKRYLERAAAAECWEGCAAIGYGKNIAPVMVDDRFADHRAKPGHPIGQPFRNVAAMQWQIGASGLASHQSGGPEVRGYGRDRAVLIAINMANLFTTQE